MSDSRDTPLDDLGDATAFDDASLERLRRFGGLKLLDQMISIFMDVAPQRLAAAREGLASADATSIEMTFHALKSSSAQLGAFRMQRLCERGERDARAGSLASTPVILDALDAELPRVIQWLEKARSTEVA